LKELLQIADLPDKLLEKLQAEIRSLEDAQEKERMCLEHIAKAQASFDFDKHAKLVSIKNSLCVIIQQLEQKISQQETNMQSKPTASVAAVVFGVDYIDHEDTANFISHLEEQRLKFMASQGKKVKTSEGQQIKLIGAEIAPYFPVIQSSGYGKSRLIEHIQKTHPDYLVVYWSFGDGQPFPHPNVDLMKDL